MNKEIKDEWVNALRSGEYKQGKNYLRTDNGEGDRYCCLGVLGNECLDGKWEPYRIESDDNESRFIWIYSYLCHGGSEREARMLPECLTSDLDIKVVDWMDILSDMNDNGKTFDDIADWIEENL
jgi:hypothetical protein